ncbi:MAG: DUF4348 domain-containing protein [Proteiniphilum sp.]|nr:DUF4348 domain-containing protein [Proteiniphilum sp.]
MLRNFLPFFSVFITIFILSCNQSGDQHKKTDLHDEDILIVAQDESNKELSSSEEDFIRFIERFSRDEKFQLQRIKFPISVIVPDTGDQGMAPKEESIDKYDWEQLDLTYDSTYLTRPYDQYYQVVRYRMDTAIVEIRGINNGIYADYYFSRIDNEWYLVTLYEASF